MNQFNIQEISSSTVHQAATESCQFHREMTAGIQVINENMQQLRQM